MKYIVIAILLIAIQALSPMPGKASTPSGQSGDNAKNQSQHNQNDSTSAPAINKKKQAISTDNHPDQIASQDKEQTVKLTNLPPIVIVKDKK